jgi:hypothetical protein
MVSRDVAWRQSVTALTLASLMEDTGWYKANYGASPGVQPASTYGYGNGCPFLTDNCIINGGAIPEFGTGTFCNTTTVTSDVKCDSTHQRAAKWDLVDYEVAAGRILALSFGSMPNTVQRTWRLRPSTDGNGIKTGPMYMECSLSDTPPVRNDI